jgi:uncharacterized protein YktB (UPF0637 family)
VGGTPVRLQELGQVLTRVLQLVLVQDHIKHLLQHTQRNVFMPESHAKRSLNAPPQFFIM